MSKNMVRAESDRFWFSRGQFFADTDDFRPRELSNLAFEAGARFAMRETARLSPYVNQFLEMIVLLGGPTDDELASAYWHSESGAAAQGTEAGAGAEPPY